ncbi:hypothetical protein ACFYS8_29905 [Kitasatospora sp. NPDC004615]|uniref:hypothetical protein n=1 Tax=unclassified Kitasatospora TaxID=2633591 RepID=UPI003695EEFE
MFNHLKKAAVLAGAVAAFTFPTGLTPAMAAGSPTMTACEKNWYVNGSEGYANGCFQNNYTYVSGTVYDTAADGRCPFVRAVFWDGNVRDSRWATGKGTHATVSISSPTGSHVRRVEWHYIKC